MYDIILLKLLNFIAIMTFELAILFCSFGFEHFTFRYSNWLEYNNTTNRKITKHFVHVTTRNFTESNDISKALLLHFLSTYMLDSYISVCLISLKNRTDRKNQVLVRVYWKLKTANSLLPLQSYQGVVHTLPIDMRKVSASGLPTCGNWSPLWELGLDPGHENNPAVLH